MIFIQPFIVIADFVGHVVAIVLAGFILTECISCYADSKRYRSGTMREGEGSAFLIRRRDHLLLLAAIFLFASWLIVEYFAPIHAFAYHFFFHWPVIFSVVFVCFRLSFWRRERRTSLLLVAFTVAVALHIAIDIPHIFFDTLPYDRFFRSLLKLAETMLFYFFVVSYVVASGGDAYERHAEVVRSWTKREYLRWSFGALLVLSVISVLYLLAPSRDVPAIKDGPPQEVAVRLKWIPQAQFGGMYIAEQKGHYKDKNLLVSLLPFDYEHYPVDDVLKGYGTFGVAGGDEFLFARMKGAPLAPEEVATATLQYENAELYGALSPEHERAVFAASVPLVKPRVTSVVGSMERSVWTGMAKVLHDVFRERGEVAPSTDLSDAYTTRFLP